MKLRIGICDDEELILEKLKRMISNCLEEKQQKFEVYAFSSGRSLLEQINELDVVFLDVKLPEMDGYEVGRKIQEINSECRIIMATGEDGRFEEAFRINAIRFLKKPFREEDVKEALDRLTGILVGTNIIELYRARNKYAVMPKEIKYVQAFNGYAEYYVKDCIFRKEISLNEAEEELGCELFFRVHKKYLINMNAIDLWKDGRIHIGDKEIEVARRRKSEFDKAYLLYRSRCR